MYAAKLATRKGPMIRIYEFDRFNETFFQVDMMVVGKCTPLYYRYDPWLGT